MMAPVLMLFIFYLVQCVLPSQCLFEISKFVKKDVCSNYFIKLDNPSQRMLASICETQCMIVCHDTEDCSISKCESNTNCVLGRYEGMNDIDEDDCTATEKLWVSYEAYHNRESEKKHDNGFRSLGCWKDSFDRAVPGFQGNLIVNGSYILGCYERAKSLGFDIFAVQYGGECYTSLGALKSYNKYGASSDCVSGSGGPLANDVYLRG